MAHPQDEGCSGRGWGFIAADVDDPPQCINSCRERLLEVLLPKDETFERACEALQDKRYMDREQPFHALYCCDSQLCGVDNLMERGKDPNVNWFINACQGIGYHSIIDPGPPAATQVCTSGDQDPRCQRAKSAKLSEDIVSELATSTTSKTSISSTTGPVSGTTFTSSIVPDTTHTSEDALYTTATEPSTSKNDGELSAGVKVAIVLITAITLFAIAVFIICMWRRRRSGPGHMRKHIKHPTSPPPAESQTPLVSPTVSHANSFPLTPPARLRERRFLSTLVNNRLSQMDQSKNETSLPASPFYSPTGSTLTSRHELSKPNRNLSSPPTPRTLIPCITPTSQEFHIQSPSIPPTSYSPLERPTRPSEVFDLASPGPPPTRALPSTPSAPPTPTKSPHRRNRFPTLTKDLYDVTEDPGYEARQDSWGSWSAGVTDPRRT